MADMRPDAWPSLLKTFLGVRRNRFETYVEVARTLLKNALDAQTPASTRQHVLN